MDSEICHGLMQGLLWLDEKHMCASALSSSSDGGFGSEARVPARRICGRTLYLLRAMNSHAGYCEHRSDFGCKEEESRDSLYPYAFGWPIAQAASVMWKST